jgi:hypothetical protein
MCSPCVAWLAAAALALSSPLAAQEVDSVRPAVLAPGALVRVEGSGLASVREVRFTALGPDDALMVRAQPVLRAADDALLVAAPAFADAPPHAAPLSPWAWLTADGATPRPVFLLESAAGRVRAAGAGSQRPDGTRLGASFDLAGGPPLPGNAGFALTLSSAPAGAAAFVLVGSPAPPPLLRVRDAALAVDLSASWVLVGPFVVQPGRDLRVELPVPAVTGFTLATQWVVRGGAELLLSDALVAEL